MYIMSIPEFEVYMHLKIIFFFYGHPVSFLFDSPFPAQQVVGPALSAKDIISYKDKALVYTATCLANKKTSEDIFFMLQLGKW